MDKSVRRLILGLLIVLSIFTGLVYLNYVSLIADHSNATSTIPMPNEKSISGLRVVVDDDYPPYTFRNENGVAVGIIVDYWRLWEKKTGVTVEISAKDWARAQQEMQAGRYDVIDTIFKNPEREKLYDFSRPYTRLDTVIFFNKNLPGITGLESLRGFNVGVKSGGHSTTVLRQAGISGIVEFKSYEEIIRAARRPDG